jgi:predicted transposase YdaD
VLPICLYHGSPSPYPYSPDIYEDFEDPELARGLVFKPFQLVDLTKIPVEVLRKDGLAAMMEILLKAYQAKKELQSILEYVAEQGLFNFVLHHTSEGYFDNVLNYSVELGNQHNSFSADQLIELLQRVLPEKREYIMTFREQLEQKGRQKGRQEGRQEGMQLGIYEAKREDAKKMLEKGIAYAIVKEITGLSDVELKTL